MVQNEQIYNDPLWQPYPASSYSFSVGDYVYAIEVGNNYYTRAVVISVINDVYTIEFDNGTVEIVSNVNDLLVYYPCNCNGTINGTTYSSGFVTKPCEI